MQLAQARFADNGGCGYLLKPSRFRSAIAAAAEAHPRKLTRLQVKLISGQHLPKPGQRRALREPWQLDHCPLLRPHQFSTSPVSDPFVVVEAFGGRFAAVADDLDACRHGAAWTSRAVSRNGLSPKWMQSFEVGVSDPDCAVLRMTVWDKQPAQSAPRR